MYVAQWIHPLFFTDEVTRLQFETDMMKDERAELEEEVFNEFPHSCCSCSFVKKRDHHMRLPTIKCLV